MTYSANNANPQSLRIDAQSPKLSVVHIDHQDASILLDGSVAGLNAVLLDLVAIVGQDNNSHTAPILEIQFGDICTLTSAQEIQGNAFLSVAVLLPRHDKADCSSVGAMKYSTLLGKDGDWECLWHADKGHHVLVHNIAINSISDECGIMDAIIESAEQATLWFAVHCGGSVAKA